MIVRRKRFAISFHHAAGAHAALASNAVIDMSQVGITRSTRWICNNVRASLCRTSRMRRA